MNPPQFNEEFIFHHPAKDILRVIFTKRRLRWESVNKIEITTGTTMVYSIIGKGLQIVVTSEGKILQQ